MVRAKIKMLHISFIALLTFASTSFVTTASAVDQETTSDLHCLAVGFALGALNDQRSKSAGLVMTSYYLGRLDGSAKGVDLEKGITIELPKMTPQAIKIGQKTCGALLISRANFLNEVASHLEATHKIKSSSKVP